MLLHFFSKQASFLEAHVTHNPDSTSRWGAWNRRERGIILVLLDLRGPLRSWLSCTNMWTAMRLDKGVGVGLSIADVAVTGLRGVLA